MKKAVMYGAGNIGRGFIGEVFSRSGYEVCFLDIEQDLIRLFNEKREYLVHIVDNETDAYETVKNVCAVDASSDEAIEEIASCDIMATAVGVNILPRITNTIAQAVRRRIAKNGGPLDILLAENQIHADKMMREWIYADLSSEEQQWAEDNLGLVEMSIGRMVPPLTDEEKEKNPLLIAVEPYCELPADSCGFKGEIPKLVGLVPFTPFDFYIKRKLYLHNMGHAICAYLGWKKGYEYIAQAIGDQEIFKVVSDAMGDAVQALHKEYPQIPISQIEANKEDLLSRFRNKATKDTVVRVAADPIRKLRNSDRLIGGALYCQSQGIIPNNIIVGIVAAFEYNNPNDVKSLEIAQSIKNIGLEETLKNISEIDVDSVLGKMIVKKWNEK